MNAPPAPPAPDREPEARAVLERHWGYPSFRSGQWRAMSAVLAGRDALTILPTGGGKSLCYQVPALLLEGLTLVVSPLVALMEDQVMQLQRRGIRATFINSTLSRRTIEERWNEALFGDLKLLYLAPERLQTEVFRARADRLKVSLLAVDEAHCISEWGHSFRPSYLKIAEARELVGDPPTIAVTATATPYVRRDIQERLGLRSPETVVTGFDRPNLTWSIFGTENKRGKVLEVLTAVPGSGIVYAGTRRGTEEWAAWLERQEVSAACYHGGLPAETRSAAQDAWIRNACRVMVATNAFGMGIDKPDVRFVIHVDLPASLESYYQEAGRGGRDGRRAHAVLIYHQGDEETPQRLLERSHPDRPTVRRVYETLCSLAGVAIGELPEAPFPLRTDLLLKSARVSETMLAGVLELLARQEVISVYRPSDESLLVHFTATPESIRAFAESTRRASLRSFVLDLLRMVPAEAFDTDCELSRSTLARKLGIDADRVERGLSFLQERSLLRWYPGRGVVLVTLLSPRSAHVPYSEADAARARKRSETRLEDMVRYARSTTCRRRFLLGYFGESASEQCGKCDVCLNRHQSLVVTPAHEPLMRQILSGIAAGTDRTTWFAGEAPRRRDVDALIAWLLEEEYLRLDGPGSDEMTLTSKGERLITR